MFAWLNGPGRSLREPIPGSTNYLGAYDKAGRMRRSRRQEQEQAEEKENGEENGQQDARSGSREQTQKHDPAGERNFRPNGDPSKSLDQKPYPLNEYFMSQPVLSEQLRENIYQEVVQKGSSISQASIRWHVDMRRVAAVVRLKSVEKQWIEEVCYDFLLSSPPLDDDCQKID